MQYNRDADGKLTPLPKPSVDTGMGFERVCAVLQGVHNNYDTDLFTYLIDAIAKQGHLPDKTAPSLKVIADHIRSCTFLIADGVLPSNEGRGYVLRRIIRRAIRHGHKLGFREPFFHHLVAPLIKHMGDAYPQLQKSNAEKILFQEEQQFAKTLDHGLKILDQELAKLTQSQIPGAVVFRLYDTYGFPVDLTADIARERNLTLDYDGFESAMANQRRQSQAASKFVDVGTQLVDLGKDVKTEFVGYDFIEMPAKVIALLDAQNSRVTSLSPGHGAVILDQTPFYVESGGQVSDIGTLIFNNGRFHVCASRKEGDVIIHVGQLEGTNLNVDQTVTAKVDTTHRLNTAYNHSATHLLHAALRKVMGHDAQQKGSLVEPTRLRFDYASAIAPTEKQLLTIEHLVNSYIRANVPVETEVLSFEKALAKGADALFGEKYGDRVRLLRMGDLSLELCGGTHVKRTGDIGLFKIIADTSISAGVRRIEAITGEYAINYFDETEQTLNHGLQLLKASRETFIEKFNQQLEKNKQLEKDNEQLQAKLLNAQNQSVLAQALKIKDKTILVHHFGSLEIKLLRLAIEQLKNQLPNAVIILSAEVDDKASIICAVTGKCQPLISANELIQILAQDLLARGGGKKDFAQAGGGDLSKLTSSLEKIKQGVITKIEGAH